MYKKNILISWVSRWLWQYLYNKLNKEFNVYGISRTIWDNNKNYIVDLSKTKDIENFSNKIKKKNILFDIIIMNAWVWYYWDFYSNKLENYEEIININLISNIKLIYILKENFHNNIKYIFIASKSSKKFLKNSSVYTASKFWLRWFAWALKADWKKVFLINPSILDTDFHHNKAYINPNISKTSLYDVYIIINNIINGIENRFEIDF